MGDEFRWPIFFFLVNELHYVRKLKLDRMIKGKSQMEEMKWHCDICCISNGRVVYFPWLKGRG